MSYPAFSDFLRAKLMKSSINISVYGNLERKSKNLQLFITEGNIDLHLIFILAKAKSNLKEKLKAAQKDAIFRACAHHTNINQYFSTHDTKRRTSGF